MLTIQDFALYPQAICQLPSGTKDRISGIDYLNNELFFENAYKTFSVYAFKAQDCKIVLRPLSSLTESEARELYEVTLLHKWTDGDSCLNFWWKEKVEWPIKINGEDLRKGEPNCWRWLLAHHFDLFGFLESGDAIESTTPTI